VSNLNEETVLSVHHWNDTLFSFTTTRNPNFRFKNGHFVMLGMEVEGRPLLRAYSMASPNYADHLEFYSIKVQEGALTSRLQHLTPGDRILISRRPTGTLVVSTLRPGKNLYLLASGTGLAPFMSIIRDEETYEKFDKVIIAHSVRYANELGYADYIANELANDELVGDRVGAQLHYYPTVTREPFERSERLTTLLESGRITEELGLPAFGPVHDRVMICGSPSMLGDLTSMLEARGFVEGSTHAPGDFTVERAFVEK